MQDLTAVASEGGEEGGLLDYERVFGEVGTDAYEVVRAELWSWWLVEDGMVGGWGERTLYISLLPARPHASLISPSQAVHRYAKKGSTLSCPYLSFSSWGSA